MLLLFDPAGAPVLYQCSRMGEETPLIPEEENTGMTEEEAGESRMDALLASLNMMGDAGAASADGGAAPSPFFGGGDVSGALAACADGKAGTELMDALLLYWENAERRSAAEANLERTRQLLEETRALGGETAGLEAEAAALESAIEDCTGEMGKASLTAQEAAGADPAAFDVADAAVMFDPSQLDVEDLALMTAAYVQGRGETVDTSAMALHLKTALVDLTTAYKGVQTALQDYEDAGTASRQAATAYAMETGSKTAWFSALSAKEDIKVCSAFVGNYNDTAKALELANMQIGKNADIIFAACGGASLGVFQACKDAGKLAIGCDSDQYSIYNAKGETDLASVIMTSCLKKIDVSLESIMAHIADGEDIFADSQAASLNLADGVVGIADNENYQKFVSAETQELVKQAEEDIKAGKVEVRSAYFMSQDEIDQLVNSVTP